MTEERSLTWKVALLGAVSALAGAAIGSVTSVVIAERSNSQQSVARLEEQRRDAYTGLLAVAQQQKAVLDNVEALEFNDFGVDVRGPEYLNLVVAEVRRIGEMPAALAPPIALVFVYGTPDAVEAAAKLQVAVGDVTGTTGRYLAATLPAAQQVSGPRASRKHVVKMQDSIDAVQTAISELIITMREDLGPK
jgi:hypothetical protein